MASIEAWGGPSGNSLPLIQAVSAGATPASLARCANAASVRPAAIIPAKARRENMSCSYRLMFFAKSRADQRWLLIVDGEQSEADRPWIQVAPDTTQEDAASLEAQNSIKHCYPKECGLPQMVLASLVPDV